MFKKIFLFIFIISFTLNAKDISLHDAWMTFLDRSNLLKAKQEDIKIAQFDYKKARDLHQPDISLNLTYTHLGDPVRLNMNDLTSKFDASTIENVSSLISKNAGKLAYEEAINKGASHQIASNIASKVFDKTKSSLTNLPSLDLSKQDIFLSTINASMPLYAGGKIMNYKKIAKEAIVEKSEIFKLTKQKLFENFIELYYGVVVSKQILKTKEEMVNALQKHYENAKKLFLYGQIAKVETLSAKSRLDKAIIDAKRAKSEFEIASITLSEFLDSSEILSPNDTLFMSQNLPEVGSFLDKTMELSSIINIHKSKQIQTQSLIKAKRGEYAPNIFLFGAYSLYNDDSLLSKSAPDWMVGVGFNYKLYDSKGRKSELDKAKSKNLQASLMLEEQKKNLKIMIKKLHKEALNSIEEYKSLDSSLSLAEENLNLREKSFSQGLGTSLDVIDAELFLQSIKTQKIVSSYKFVLVLSKLLSQSDSIDEFFNYLKRSENEKI